MCIINNIESIYNMSIKNMKMMSISTDEKEMYEIPPILNKYSSSNKNSRSSEKE